MDPDTRVAADEIERRFHFAWGRILLLLVVVTLMVWYAFYGPREAQLLQHQQQIKQYVNDHFMMSLVLFLILIVIGVSLSLPLGAGFALFAGFVFGRWYGIVVINVGNTIGAILAFLTGRYLLHDFVNRLAERHPRLQRWMKTINDGVDRDGAYYLLVLRLTPIVPYFILNFACGLTKLPVRTFWWVSQLSMLPVTYLYVNAGASASEITALRDLISVQMIGAMLLLFIVPIILKRVLR